MNASITEQTELMIGLNDGGGKGIIATYPGFIPEPGSCVLVAVGMLALLGMRSRHRAN